MILQPRIQSRESALLYGDQGTGKSSQILSIARKITGDLHVVDSDYAYERLIETEFSDVRDKVHVNYVDDQDWKNQLDTAQKVRRECGDDDWFVFDSATPGWAACEEWYYQEIYGEDRGEHFLKLRIQKEDKGGKLPVDRINDDKWSTINPEYKRMHKVFMPGALPGREGPYRGHLILTMEATNTSSEFDDKNTKNLFGELGKKPKGQKRVPFLVHTILLLNKRRGGVYEATTVKDRGREELVDEPVSQDFASWYLRKIARWRPGRGVTPDASVENKLYQAETDAKGRG